MPRASIAYSVFVLFTVLLCSASAQWSTTPFAFGGASTFSLKNDNSAPRLSDNSFTVSKDGSDRYSGVVDFVIPTLGQNEYYYIAKIQIPVLSVTSFTGSSLRINIRPVGSFDLETVTYDSLERLSDPIDQSGIVSSNIVVSLDVTLALEDNIRTFEIALVGGGASAEVILGVPSLVLEYPSWRFEPIESGCVTVETPVPGVAAPGIVSRECQGTGSQADIFWYQHGAPSFADMFDDMPAFMQVYGLVVLPNLPGNGRSGDIIMDATTANRPWGELVSEAMTEWARIRNFTNIHITGQDYGAPTAVDVADKLISEGRIASWGMAEGVSMDQLLCPSNDGSDGCYTDGGMMPLNPNGSENEFMDLCFGQNIAGIVGTMTEGLRCADYMLGQNWFDNIFLLFDPIVRTFAAQINPVNASATYLAYPSFIFPGGENVYKLLSAKKRSDAFYAAKYCNGVPCAQAQATQGQQYWPRTLNTHGRPAGPHNIWNTEFNLRARASMESGNLSTVPGVFHCLDDLGFVTISNCVPAHVELAKSRYPSLSVNYIGGGMGHFFTEEGFNGAYSLARSQADVLQLSA